LFEGAFFIQLKMLKGDNMDADEHGRKEKIKIRVKKKETI
jgi:hypothetical protein